MADELLGKILGKYKIESLIGRGGMAIVYLATHQQLATRVALKMLPAGFADQPEMAERFLREARTAAQLNHPNIVRVYDVDQIDGISFFIMDFVEGRSLKEILKEKGKLPEDQIVSISKSVVSALKAAHSKGIVHRDIKPDNIMIDPKGSPLVTDFGIAKTTIDSDLTRTGMFLGTMRYASPEQIKGETVDGCSEMYSWGVVMYEMATGVQPYKSEEPTAILYNILHENPEDPALVNPSLSHHLAEIISKAMAKEKDERFGSADELLEALESFPLKADDATRLVSGVEDATRVLSEAEDPTRLLSVEENSFLATESGDDDQTRFFTGDELLRDTAGEQADEIPIGPSDKGSVASEPAAEKKRFFSLRIMVLLGFAGFAFAGFLLYANSDFFLPEDRQKTIAQIEPDSQAEEKETASQQVKQTQHDDKEEPIRPDAGEMQSVPEKVGEKNHITAAGKADGDGKEDQIAADTAQQSDEKAVAEMQAASIDKKEPVSAAGQSTSALPSKTFTLNISVIPDYAKVFVNGAIIQKSNSGVYSLNLPKGYITVQVKAEKHVSYFEEFELQKNHDLKIELMPIDYSVAISVTPKESIVAVDGNTIDSLSAGMARLRLAQGEHTITVGASGYKTKNLPVYIDQDRLVEINLEKINKIEIDKVAIGNQVTKDEIEVWTDKKEYSVGDNLKIYFKAKKDCYVYLYYESADGDIQRIFPNQFTEDNYIEGGRTYTIPDPSFGYQFTVQPPLGTERIKALVTSEKRVAAEWQQLGVRALRVKAKEIEDSTTLRVIQ